MPRPFPSVLLACLILSGVAAPSAPADTPDHQAARFASGSGNVLYLALGAGLPLLTDGRDGQQHTYRAVDALGATALLTEGLKALTREKRPDSNAHDSFPSGHASAAFAVAAVESRFHPREAPLWYLGAALIAASRLRLHRHTSGDVLAGSALGLGVAEWELAQPRGLILTPLIGPNAAPAGLSLSARF